MISFEDSVRNKHESIIAGIASPHSYFSLSGRTINQGGYCVAL